MECEEAYWSCGAAQQFPARHFPAFCASWRIGGGFSVEGLHSNAHYSRHLRPSTTTSAAAAAAGALSQTNSFMSACNSKSSVILCSNALNAGSRSQPVSLSMSPEVLNAAAQAYLSAAGTAEAVKAADPPPSGPAARIKLATTHTCLHNSCEVLSMLETKPMGQQVLQEPSGTAAAVGGAVGDYSLTSGMPEFLQQQQPATSMPTTYCRGLSTPHSTWQHDGTDFSKGHMEQVVPKAWKRRPSSAYDSSRPTSPTMLNVSSRYMEPSRKQWEQMQHRPVKGPLTSEARRIMDPMRRVNLSNDSWFCSTPVEVLKIERENQRAAEQQWLAQFHPTDDAKYPARSLAVHKHLQAAWCGDDEQNGNKAETRVAFKAAAANSTEGTLAASTATFYHTLGVEEKDSLGANADAAAATNTLVAKEVQPTAWWEADKDLARAVRQMLQPCFASANLSRGGAVIGGDSKTSSSSSPGVVQHRATYSATLGVYDSPNGLIADNAVKAGELGQQMALQYTRPNDVVKNSLTSTYVSLLMPSQRSSQSLTSDGLQGCLQTPEQLHAAWVAELANRTVSQRQHQILLEAAHCMADGAAVVMGET